MTTEKWTDSIDKNTEDFLSTFGNLTEEQLNWKPNEQTWSIAQNVDHLIKINESYYPLLDSIHKGTFKVPITGRVTFLVTFFGKLLLKSVQPNEKRKVKTFSIWEPVTSKIKPDILDRFKAHHEDLKEQIANSEQLMENGAVISSPANKLVVYKLETAFDIIIAHEQRHYQQAKQLLPTLPVDSE